MPNKILDKTNLHVAQRLPQNTHIVVKLCLKDAQL